MSGANPRVLVIRTGAFGDVCLLVPIVRAMQSHFAVDWLVSDRYAPVLRCFPDLACRILEADSDPRAPSPFPESLVRRLQREGYGVCLDFSHWPAVSELVAQLSAIPVRAITHDPIQDSLLGVNPRAIDLYGPFNRLFEVDPTLHQIEKGRALVENVCGVKLKLDGPSRPRPPLGKILHIFVQVHASKKIKRWPVRYFASVLRALARDRPVHCLVNAEPERYVRRLEWLLLCSGCRVERVPFDPDFTGLKERLSTVDFALGCDSGPMHFAGLLGIPTVVIYGPYSAREFRPLGWTMAVSPPGENLPADSVSTRRVREAVWKLVEDLESGKVGPPGLLSTT